ncbi:MAG TPA: HepT-like ribonuclease domain-containing protein [Candidatus Omnitrophota bacterium]|nr:HepT-like ribonuclease domain-containing protein [Candidatus Omnitrophota bacterium]
MILPAKINMEELKDYFANQKNISMAFIFGSFAKGQHLPDSDVDIAVYFNPQGRAVEWEEETFYPEEDRIWRELENLLDREVDLLILNRAPSTMASKIIKTGLPIFIKDRSFYWRFFLTVNSASADFKEFIQNYRRIRERSKSLNAEDKEQLENLIDFLEEELKSYGEFRGLNQTLYESDRGKKRNVEHWVEGIALCSIDIAEIVLASEKIRLPEKYKEILKSLSLLKDFDKNTAERLGRLAGLRNMITHEYLDIRWRQIEEFIKTSQPLYEYLIAFVKKNFLRDGK